VRGKRPERRWKPIHPNVEVLDALVYSYVALLLHGIDRMREPTAAEPTRPRPQQQPKRPGDPWTINHGGSWMGRRRGGPFVR